MQEGRPRGRPLLSVGARENYLVGARLSSSVTLARNSSFAQGLLPVGRVGQASQDDNRGRVRLVLFQRSENLVPVDSRHLDVEHHQVVGVHAEHGQRVLRLAHAVSGGLKQLLEH